MSSFFENVPMTVAVSACSMLISLLALFYARKNLKMQKYIDVVTAQRIKWIYELRQDFSMIISHLYLIVYLKSYAESEEDEFVNQFNIDHSNETDIDFEDSLYYDSMMDVFKNMRDIGSELSNNKNNIDFIRRIELSIMKLNEADPDDRALIESLEKAKKDIFYEPETKIVEEKIANLRGLMTRILKNEWERVKKEVQKGGLVNGRRKNIFG